jgi:amidase
MSPILTRSFRRATTILVALVIGHCSLVTSAKLTAATFNLETAGIQEIQAAVDAGALTYEKLATLYLARIEAYDQKGPALNTVITLNKKLLDEARAADAEFKAKGRRSPLHGIPVLVKDNFDVVGMPNTGGSFLLEGNMPEKDAPMIKNLRDAGALFLAKVNLDEFAAGGHGFSSLGGQTKNPHNLKHVPLGSSGATGAGLAAWFAPLGLGTDTGGSIRGPSFANGVPGIKPTNGLLSRTGIIPRVLSFDTGGPMARTVYDVAVSLGFMTGVDPADPLTETSAGLFYKDYTVFLKKDSLKGARIGIVRDLSGSDPEVDKVFNAAVAELKSLGAVIVDPIHYPSVVEARASVMEVMRGADIREEYAKYLATLKGDFPKTLDEMIARADAFTKPRGKITPHPSLYNRFKVDNLGAPSSSLIYKSAKVHGMAMIRDAVLGVIEKHQLDALVYPTFAKRPELIDPAFATKPRAPFSGSLTNLANVTQFPDVIVPAGVTSDKLPVTISFFGPAYSEPRLLAYAYAYEQAFPHRVSPSTTPALPGEKFDY